ncbi:MAG: amidohydrolase family protein, partial [Clostridia bacterium]|nr:amidohydrolase family protein [Clostridia bacterium]
RKKIMNYDYILRADTIYTMDDDAPKADWVAVRDGKIAKVGMGEIPEGEEVKDYGSNTILPGLIDTHVHAYNTAVMYEAVNLIECTTVQQVLDLVEKRCVETDEDLVLAWNYVVLQIEEARFPTIQELDAISHGKKVQVISITLHTSSINTAIYESLDYSQFDYGLEMDEGGNFTGYLCDDEPNFYTSSQLIGSFPKEKVFSLMDKFGEYAVSVGLTSAHCLEGAFVADDIDIPYWLEKIEKNELPFHAVIYPQIWDYEKAKQWNLPRHGGCLTLDGADAEFTMALNEPYTCKPEIRGNLYHKDIEVYNLVKKAYGDGKQITFHAMGDRAINQVVDAYRRVIAEDGQKELRLRIEHFTLPTDEDLALAAKMHVIACPQPEYTDLYDTPGGPMEQIFGKERVETRFEQYKKFMDAGVIVCGGSDAPVNSLNPLTGIHGFVNARFDTRRLTVTEALKAYTYWAAYAAFEEHERGTIKEGFYADFTILGEDPYEVPDKIRDIQVKGTISEGRVVYEQ